MLLKDKEYVKTMTDEIKELSRNRHTYYDKFELYEIFCQTVKYTTQEFIDKRHMEHHQKLNQVRQKIKKIEKLRPQEIMDNEKKEMDNLKLQEQELMKFWAEKLREKVKIPIVEEKE